MEGSENRHYIGIIISGILHILILFICIQLAFSKYKTSITHSPIEVVFEEPPQTLNVTEVAPNPVPTNKAEEKQVETKTPAKSTHTNSPPKTVVTTPEPKPSGGSTTQENSEVVANTKKKYGDLFGKKNEGNSNAGNGDDPKGEGALSGISQGNGIVGGGLTGRKAIEIPAVAETSQKTGRVVVKVCVASDGRVTSARYTQQGSTTSDAQLVRMAEKGAAKYRFSPAEIETQCGTITFDFKLQ